MLVHKTRVSGLRMAAGMSHEITGPEKMAYQDRVLFRTWAGPPWRLRWRRARSCASSKYLGYGWSSQRSRPALIDQVVGALAAARLTGWDGLLAEQRAVPGGVLGRRRRRGGRRRRDPAGGALRAVPHPAGRGAGRVPADRGEGPDRDRLRRAHVLGHRERSCCRCSCTPSRPPRPTRCAGGTWCWPRPSSTPPSSAWPGPRSRGGRSAARSAPATGPPGPPRSTSTPTSPTPWSATWTPPRMPSSSRKSASSCWSRPRGCGGRSASTTRWAGSGSRA